MSVILGVPRINCLYGKKVSGRDSVAEPDEADAMDLPTLVRLLGSAHLIM